MPILSFSFEDRLSRWSLAPTSFGPLNLLVGRSGAGKTRILSALRRVRDAGIGQTSGLVGCSWVLELEAGGARYRWEAETATEPATATVLSEASRSTRFRGRGASRGDLFQLAGGDAHTFRGETVSRDGQTILARSPEGIELEGKPYPALKDSESVVSMLRSHSSIAGLGIALEHIHPTAALDAARGAVYTSEIVMLPEGRRRGSVNPVGLPELAQSYTSLEALRSVDSLGLAPRTWILRQRWPDVFDDVASSFKEIFPSVQEVQVAPVADLRPDRTWGEGDRDIDIAIREEGVHDWILSDEMSSGMRRTLLHLLELALSPTGTVILIDEYENSLGVNCIGGLTDVVVRRSRDLQFILTSHHPYVINNIPKSCWRIVTRTGGVVRVRDASEFPELDTASNQDQFIQLLQAMDAEECP